MPSQKAAGVTKSAYKKGEKIGMEGILKKLETGNASLSGEESRKLLSYIDTLKQSAKDGVYYRDSLTSDVLRLSATVQPEISRETMESVAKTMTVSQLKEFKTAFEKKKNEMLTAVPQLYSEKNKNNTVSNGQFRI